MMALLAPLLELPDTCAMLLAAFDKLAVAPLGSFRVTERDGVVIAPVAVKFPDAAVTLNDATLSKLGMAMLSKPVFPAKVDVKLTLPSCA